MCPGCQASTKTHTYGHYSCMFLIAGFQNLGNLNSGFDFLLRTVEDTLKLQKDIDLLGNWARKWGMRFQPVKYKMMQLTNKRINKIEASYTLQGSHDSGTPPKEKVGVPDKI